MLKKITWLLIFLTATATLISFRGKFYSSVPPGYHSGAPGDGLCSSCHGNLNSGGGSVTINGLPTIFTPGQTYPFTVTISHGTDDRSKWGFEINARNANNNGIGSFGAGPNTAQNSAPSEISHAGAVATAQQSSYTYTGLSWTAPTVINAGDNAVTFYMAGNAANNDFSSNGDFIYSNTLLITLPVQLKDLSYKIIDNYKVKIDWKTASESNSKEFIIEKSDDNNKFYEAGRLPAAGNSSYTKTYTFIDDKPSFFNQPVYYRLKQVDADGNFKYSKTFFVQLAGRSVYVHSLMPNPASDYIVLGITSNELSIATTSIFSAAGQLIQQKNISLQKGKNNYQVALPRLAPGQYFLRLQNKLGVQSIPFVAN